MVCPDCNSEDKLKTSDGIYCKNCGLELDEVITVKNSGKKVSVIEIPKLVWKASSKQELFALKLGLKHKKLHPDWESRLGFTVDYLKPEHKKKALQLINIAFDKHKQNLVQCQKNLESDWMKINNLFFFEIEKLMNFKWDSYVIDVYLSLCAKYGFHNSSKNYIIIQHSLEKIGNYVIAHELFHLIYRHYVSRFFKENYTDIDNKMIKIIAVFVLLDYLKCFPEMKLSMEIFQDEYKQIASRLFPIWKQKTSFKEFMINSYKTLGHEKKWVSY
jgi:hypothetical protein